MKSSRVPRCPLGGAAEARAPRLGSACCSPAADPEPGPRRPAAGL